MKIFLIAGARPNFMKIAPIIRAMKNRNIFNWKLVHTGQHYDYEMSQSFFDDLELPEPDYFLEAGSGSHAEQTAKVMCAFEDVCIKDCPDLVIVVGDVNSTLACSIVAKKMGVKVAHVEAGLRSYDMSMPEEINRMVTDAISDLFFVTEHSGVNNLLKEGKPESRIHFVGHVMIDNLLQQIKIVDQLPDDSFQHNALKTKLGDYSFLTLHRPSNVDNKEVLTLIVCVLNEIASKMPVIFPVHPRTRKMLKAFGLNLSDNIHCLQPLGFREALYLWKDAVFVITDSGGLQEETTALGVPCITLRENTERPITCEMGTNQLVGNDPDRIKAAVEKVLFNNDFKGLIPPKWDGRSAERILDVLEAVHAEIEESSSMAGQFE